MGQSKLHSKIYQAKDGYSYFSSFDEKGDTGETGKTGKTGEINST
jgi:hypothetical protein